MNVVVAALRGRDFGSIDVDVIVPMRNEASTLPRFVSMLRDQTLQPRRIIIADGGSVDGSREIATTLTEGMPSVLVVDNPARVVPAALNVCMKHVQSPIVARMDTHATYRPDYLATLAATLVSDPTLAGVGASMRTEGRGPWGQAIASTLRRSFGLGGARHRVGGAPGEIAHIFSGCYRTEAVRSIGGWDERFHANEDFEADTRLREAGGVLWLETTTESTWYVRETPRKLALQMWRYGYYKGLTIRLHPRALKTRQLVPPLLVLGLPGLTIKSPRLGLLATSAYLVASAALGATAARRDGADSWRGAVVPATVHLCWGAGLIGGSLRFAVSRRSVTSDV